MAALICKKTCCQAVLTAKSGHFAVNWILSHCYFIEPYLMSASAASYHRVHCKITDHTCWRTCRWCSSSGRGWGSWGCGTSSPPPSRSRCWAPRCAAGPGRSSCEAVGEQARNVRTEEQKNVKNVKTRWHRSSKTAKGLADRRNIYIIKGFHFQNVLTNEVGPQPNCSTQTQTTTLFYFLWEAANTRLRMLLLAAPHWSLVWSTNI